MHRVEIAPSLVSLITVAPKLEQAKAQGRDTDGKRYSYDYLIQKDAMEIKTLASVSKSEVNSYLEDRNLFAKEMRKIASQYGNPKGTSTSTYLHCNDLNADVMITRDSFKHGADRTMDSIYISVCKSIKDVLENSIVVNEVTERDDTDGGYVLLGLTENDEYYVVVRSIVNKKTWKLEDYNELYAVRKSDIKKEDAGLKPPHYSFKEGGYGTSSTISISSFLKFVNGQEIGNSVLSLDVVNKLGTPRISDPNVTPHLRFQERESAHSNRTLLANALSSVAQSAEEKQRLNEYKSKIRLIEGEQKKLDEINQQMTEIMFSKGKRSAETQKKLDGLRTDARLTASRINSYDRRLLELEAMSSIKNVLKREKDAVRKREKQRAREALAELRKEKNAKLDAVVKKNRETRQKAVEKARETRDKRDAKAKLQKLVLETSKWISYPAKNDVKCPDILREPYAEFLSSIDFSSKRFRPDKSNLRSQ